MAKKNGRKNESRPFVTISEETKRTVIAVVLLVAGLLLVLAGFGVAGTGGSDIYKLITYLLGAVGYFLIPILFFILGGYALREEEGGSLPLSSLRRGCSSSPGLDF